MTKEVGNYLFSTDRDKIDIVVVHQYLSRDSYWAQGIPIDIVQRSVDNSLCIGVYDHVGTQVGFGRMVTDKAVFAYLADVFILPEHRGKGLSKAMMQIFCDMADAFQLRRFILTTQDAHSLYAQFGFEPVPWPERLMHRQGVTY